MKNSGITLKSLALVAVAAFGLTFNSFASNPVAGEENTLQVAVYKVKNDPAFKVHFDNKSEGKVTIKLMDIDGNVIHTEKVKGTQIYIRKFNLKNLPSGTYIVQVANDDYLTRKAIKI